MSPTPVYIASDVHLGAVPDQVEDAFLAFLEHVAANSRHLILNGDLFDFWFEFRHGHPPGYERTLAALSRLTRDGLRIDFLGGNHDWWGGRYLRDEVGLNLHFKPQRWTLAGRESWVGHGDGEGPGDTGYKMLSAVLRNPMFVGTFRQLPAAWGDAIAQRVTSTHGRWEGPGEHERRHSDRLQRWGESLIRAEPQIELLATGHTHLPVVSEVEPGRFYVNSGDWVYHRSYLKLVEGERPALYYWAGSPMEPREPGAPLSDRPSST